MIYRAYLHDTKQLIEEVNIEQSLLQVGESIRLKAKDEVEKPYTVSCILDPEHEDDRLIYRIWVKPQS